MQFVLTYYKFFRVTSLKQLSVAEFSGEKTKPRVYENDHKNVLAIWLDLIHSAALNYSSDVTLISFCSTYIFLWLSFILPNLPK